MAWQPIETAPKDGTPILVWDNGPCVAIWLADERGPGASGYVQPPGWSAWAQGSVIFDEGWDTGTGYTLELSPTHWSPIDSGPTSS